jgi:hypothetical protein
MGQKYNHDGNFQDPKSYYVYRRARSMIISSLNSVLPIVNNQIIRAKAEGGGITFDTRRKELVDSIQTMKKLGIYDNLKFWGHSGLCTISDSDKVDKLFDFSGANNDGTSSGTARPVITALGINFDGSNDFLNCGYVPAHRFPNEISISMWCDGAGDSNSVPSGIDTLGFSGQRGWQLGFGTNIVAFVVPLTATSELIIDTPHTSGYKYYVGVAKIGEKIKIYRNGILVAQSSINLASIYTGNTTPTIIGKRSVIPYYFNGKIDDTRLYNQALTQEQISEIYNQTRKYYE